MQTIIAGSRTVTDMYHLHRALAKCPWVITEVVSGCARGADKLGERWAVQNNVPIKRFPADWYTHGKRHAGRIRNEEMAYYASHLVALWDEASPGTRHMIATAKKLGLTVVVWSTKTNEVIQP